MTQASHTKSKLDPGEAIEEEFNRLTTGPFRTSTKVDRRAELPDKTFALRLHTLQELSRASSSSNAPSISDG